jgi:acetate kinase
VQLDAARNKAGRGVLSTGAVEVRVVPSEEEAQIAREVRELL